MSTMAPLKRIKLGNGVSKPRTNSEQRKNIPWVDVSDDEDRRRKMPHINGIPNGHYGQEKNGRRKRARLPLGENGHIVNGGSAGPSSAAQEQRKQLPIAKGTRVCSCMCVGY